MPRPSDEIPQNPPDHMKLMLHLIVLPSSGQDAHLHCMLNNDLSADELQVHRGRPRRAAPRPDHGKTPATKAITQDQSVPHEQFTYLVQRLKQIDEGGAISARNSLLMFASSCTMAICTAPIRCPRGASRQGGRRDEAPARILDFWTKQRQSPRLQPSTFR